MSLAEPTCSVEQIASKVGKTPAYITTRLKLTDLCDEDAAAFYQDPVGVGHALFLAKLLPEQQKPALRSYFKEVYSSGYKLTRVLLPLRNLQFWDCLQCPANPEACALVSVMAESRIETLARQHCIRQMRDDGGILPFSPTTTAGENMLFSPSTLIRSTPAPFADCTPRVKSLLPKPASQKSFFRASAGRSNAHTPRANKRSASPSFKTR